MWQALPSDKRTIYTAGNIIPVGGAVENDPGGPSHDEKTPEPVFHQALPTMLFSELFKAFNASCVIDLTPADGSAAEAVYRKRVPHLGLVFSDAHKDLLWNELEKRLQIARLTEGDALYDALLHRTLTHTERPTKKPKPEEEDVGSMPPLRW